MPVERGAQGAAAIERWDARAGTRWRALAVFLPAAVFLFGYALYGTIYAVLAPRRFRRRESAVFQRWGRTALWLVGVRLEIRGAEHRPESGPVIVMFNHVSLFDLFVLAALWPRRGVVLYKREFHRIPVIGAALRATGMIPVDRGNREAAIRSVEEAARRAREEGATVLIAPEGTRSRRGGLQEFKMGPFHLATATGAPIVPMIMRGIEQVMPFGSLLPRTGAVRVDYLPPIPTSGWTRDEVRDRARELRELFLRYLPPAPAATAYPNG